MAEKTFFQTLAGEAAAFFEFVKDLFGEDVDPTGPPLCPSCGHRHATPAELRPRPMARGMLAGPGDSPAILRDRGARPPGWGRDRGGELLP